MNDWNGTDGIETMVRLSFNEAATLENPAPGLTRLQTIRFDLNGNAETRLGPGWSEQESTHRWMVDHESEIWLDDPGQGADLVLDLDIFPFLPEGPPQPLIITVRDTVVASMEDSRSDSPVAILIPAAAVALPGPVRIRLTHPGHRSPASIGVNDDERSLAFFLTELRLSRVEPRRRATSVEILPPDRFATRFESLGGNCEFGFWQRRMGAEPLGLLRFAGIPINCLIWGLRHDFAELADLDRTNLEIADPYGDGAVYIINEMRYQIGYNTQIRAGGVRADDFLVKQASRLRFLARKLVEDVASGEKIFVIRPLPEDRPELVLALYATMNERGRSWLLWITPADEAHPPGTVELVLPGLMKGYLGQFMTPGIPADLPEREWTLVCDKARLLAGI